MIAAREQSDRIVVSSVGNLFTLNDGVSVFTCFLLASIQTIPTGIV